ncbi:hypothetical protein [Chryseobacterium gleum]|uniref:hypothetical protein n=1 Tax=Chryseobacterium gleum TaxID=250 RepID=UPI00241CA701|nr:hypothetical protein [Chryseobacterium gleum]
MSEAKRKGIKPIIEVFKNGNTLDGFRKITNQNLLKSVVILKQLIPFVIDPKLAPILAPKNTNPCKSNIYRDLSGE